MLSVDWININFCLRKANYFLYFSSIFVGLQRKYNQCVISPLSQYGGNLRLYFYINRLVFQTIINNLVFHNREFNSIFVDRGLFTGSDACVAQTKTIRNQFSWSTNRDKHTGIKLPNYTMYKEIIHYQALSLNFHGTIKLIVMM